MVTRRVQPGRATFVVRTRAEGMLRRLAHELELWAEPEHLDLELDVATEAWRARATFPVDRIAVAGTLDGGRMVPTGVNRLERREIRRRLRRDVLPGPAVRVEARGPHPGAGTLTVAAPRGTQTVPLDDLTRSGPTSSGAHPWISGKATVSLARLGIAEIKGPLGAFRVGDAVTLSFRVHLPRGVLPEAATTHPAGS
ncbi:MAG: hypothetical protein AAGN82_21050 [Myxococcota bacterium]